VNNGGYHGEISFVGRRSGGHCADTENLGLADETFDSAVSRLGLMFLPDPLAGPILQILAPLDDGGRAAAWAQIADQLKVYQTENGWEGPNTRVLMAGQR